jgi:hypothetical protein
MKVLIPILLFTQFLHSQNVYCVKLSHGNNGVIDSLDEIQQINGDNFSTNQITFNILETEQNKNNVEFIFLGEINPPSFITGYYYNPGDSGEELNTVEEYEFKNLSYYNGCDSTDSIIGVGSNDLGSTFPFDEPGKVENDFFSNFSNHSIIIGVCNPHTRFPPVHPHIYLFFYF